MQAVDPKVIERAQTHIDKFLEIYEKEFSLSAMTYKMHSLRHMLDDIVHHKCHLEYLSSYPYENFHGKWRHFVRSGRLPVSQIRFVVAQHNMRLLNVLHLNQVDLRITRVS